MKRKNNRSTQGSVFISAVMTAGVLAILIAGVLSYMSNEYNENIRAHRWNQSFHLAESGVEIGLAQYNYQYTLGGSGFQGGSGWSSTNGTYTLTVSNLTDSSGNNTVGTLKVVASGIGGSNPQFTGVGTVTSANYGGASLTRAVMVTLAGASSSLFPYALVSKTALSFSGSAYIDSYDSSDTTKSTNGQYDPAKKQANGNIATTFSSGTAFSLAGSATIAGSVSMGPGGTATFSGGTAMGPTFVGQATTVGTAVSDGWLTSAFTSPPQDVTVPSALASASNVGTLNLHNSLTQTISGGNYIYNVMSITGNSSLTITGNVNLYILGNVAVQNSGSINIEPGSSLTVYIGGATADIEGAGIVNNGLRSENNEWYGLSTMNTATIANSGAFNGTLYAPDAKVTISGSGSISGALVVSNLVMGTSGSIHYDQSLKSTSGGSNTTCNIVSWQELRYVGGNWVP